jgi:hypothetical protein
VLCIQQFKSSYLLEEIEMAKKERCAAMAKNDKDPGFKNSCHLASGEIGQSKKKFTYWQKSLQSKYCKCSFIKKLKSSRFSAEIEMSKKERCAAIV